LIGSFPAVKPMLVLLFVLAGALTACGGGGPSEAVRAAGPSQAVRTACAPFKDLAHLGTPTTRSSPSSGPAPVPIVGSIGLPTKWVNQLLSSGNNRLVDYAKTFSASGQANNQVVGEIQSECRQLGA
jgi:hypothetical protein